jgi:hypothetical protein
LLPIEDQIRYFYDEIDKLTKYGESLIEFSEGIGVKLDSSGFYRAYFLNDGNVSCNGLCLQRDYVEQLLIVHFTFLTSIETARFIVINMLKRKNQLILLLEKGV